MGFEGSTLWSVRQKVGTDLVLWPGASVVVVREDERVLLANRLDNGMWAIPGGGAERGSSFTDTGHGLVRWVDPEDRDPLAEFLLWQPAANLRPGDLDRYTHLLVHGPPPAALAWASNTGALDLVAGRGNWGLFARR